MSRVDWADVAQLAALLKDPHAGPAAVSDVEWRKIEQTVTVLRREQDWAGIVRLRTLFAAACTRDTFTGSALIRQLEEEAIHAAEQLEDKLHLAMFWGDRGHNLHRQGFHRESIEAFDSSSRYYQDLHNNEYVLRNRLMTALCLRALHRWEDACRIAIEVLEQVPAGDSWRGQPLQMLAWLYKDQGEWQKAEDYLREALAWQGQSGDADILVAGTLADIGELWGLQGRFEEAQLAFTESLSLLDRHQGQYDRQEARTKLKLAELRAQQGKYELALQLLLEADRLCCMYGHYYDQLWKIELVMASVLFRTGEYRGAAAKLASALHIRRRLNLSTWLLVKKLLDRYRARFAARLLYRGGEGP